MADMIKITVLGGADLGKELSVPLEGAVLVGRSHSAAIRFKEADVSGKHLELVQEDGTVWMTNLSRYKAVVNGADFASGERRPLKAGDDVRLGTRARFRVDSVGGAAQEDAPSVTGSTRAVEMDGETQPMTGTGTFATQAAEATLATRAAEPMTDGTFAPQAAEVVEAASMGAIGFADEATTGDDGATIADSATDSGTGDGQTQDLKTRPISMIELNRLKLVEERRRRVRRSLMTFAILAFAAVLGGIVWWRWPKAERWLQHPRPTEIYTVRGLAGNAFVVDFPQDGRMRKSAEDDGRGIEVSSFTGTARDVPFRLSVVRTRSAGELQLSLTESAQKWMESARAREGLVFLSPGDWPEGECFFESDYPGSFEKGVPLLQRGTRFYRSEYMVVRGGAKWHGTFFRLRDGEEAFTIRREIPESEWARGLYLIREDPNVQLYPQFVKQRWESPGKNGLLEGREIRELMREVSEELELPVPRVANWPAVKRSLDTLVLLAWNESADVKKQVRVLLQRFQKQQDDRYNEFVNAFNLADRLGNGGGAAVRADCQRVFGNDPSDRRFLLVNNPEIWSCRQEY